MTKKSTEAYKAVFAYINDNIFDLNASSFMTDYESGLRKALKEMYPTAKMVSCWFHFCQAVRRKCSKIPNFFAKIQKNEAAERLFLKFLALPLLPADKILEAFNMLKLAANATSGIPFKSFLKYFESQWLQKVSLFLLMIKIYRFADFSI